MLSTKAYSLAAAFFAASVNAHGHVDWLVADGVAYKGYDSPAAAYSPSDAPVVGWTIDQKDNGFVQPVAVGDPDIICHRSAMPAGGHATVEAGSTLNLHWNTWPESHKGPIFDYLAKCDGDCESVDKTDLEFFKIDAGAFIDMSISNGGKWAPDVLIENDFSWTVKIPESIAPGNYVLRHEIIALHSASQLNGAQLYPQCFNLKITGSGSLSPAGVKGTSLYKEDDPGIMFNLYTSPIVYPEPGPTLNSAFPSTVSQGYISATATSSATVPGGDNGGGSPPKTTSKTTMKTTMKTTTAAAPPKTTTAAPPSGGGNGGTAQKYGQCGGQGWDGPTQCAAGSTCKKSNDYYSQCL